MLVLPAMSDVRPRKEDNDTVTDEEDWGLPATFNLFAGASGAGAYRASSYLDLCSRTSRVLTIEFVRMFSCF